MDPLAAFAATVVAVSASGVLAPGPLLAAGISFGIRNGISGALLVALGHAVVELPLVVALGAGLVPLEAFPDSRAAISLLGAAGMFGFAAFQVRAALRPGGDEPRPRILERYGAFAAGAALSALNPFFLSWWATVGLKLIADSQAIWPVWGPQILFAIHIPLDFAWLCLIAAFALRGSHLLRGRMRAGLEIGLAGLMSVIGAVFALEALSAMTL